MTPVLVVGSANLDHVTRVANRPSGGETVMGSDIERTPGGKGLNQAVAAGRLGHDVRFAGCVGADVGGRLLRECLETSGVDTSGLLELPGQASGAALITVTPDGENSIVVSPGANAQATAERLDLARLIPEVATVVMQLEVPMTTVHAVALRCADTGVRFILNAAPAAHLADEVLAACDPLVVNESEARYLLARSGPATPEDLLAGLNALPARSVVLTLGRAGSIARDREGLIHREPALPVHVVDTTGAGDAFVGALAVALTDGADMASALRQATRVAAFAVGRQGAAASYPTAAEVAAELG